MVDFQNKQQVFSDCYFISRLFFLPGSIFFVSMFFITQISKKKKKKTYIHAKIHCMWATGKKVVSVFSILPGLYFEL